jgi:hypothetical protein
VNSEREFSVRWLGRAPNYACENRLIGLSPATGIRLAKRLIAAEQRELAAAVMASLFNASRG